MPDVSLRKLANNRVEPHWSLLSGMFLAAALAPLGSTMIAVALPSIGQELGVDNESLTQWLVASYLIVGIACMSPAGTLGDRIGHRASLVLGMLIYAGGALTGFMLASLPSLAFARICMAAGGALMVPAVLAMLRRSLSASGRTRMFGYFGAVMGTAAAIGPLVGGELTSLFGWRSVFIANVPVIVVALLLLRYSQSVRSDTGRDELRSSARFDVFGSVLLGAGLTLAIVPAALTSTHIVEVRVAGAILLGLFVVWERRVDDPVLDLRLFTRRSFVAASLVIGLQNLAMYALLFQLPIFFEQVRNAEAGTSGRVVIAMMLAMVVCSPIGGRVAERVGPRLTVLAGSILTLGGVYLVNDFGRLLTPADALVGLTLLGAGFGLCSAPSQASAMSAVAPAQAGMAAGAISTVRYIGGVIGISALGAVVGRVAVAGTELHSSAARFYAVSLLAAAAVALMLPNRLQDERSG